MKYVLLIVAAFAASLFVWSCSSTTTTPAQSSVTIITDTVSLNFSINYVECFRPPVEDSIYVAHTDSAYRTWRSFRNTSSVCTSVELPTVDFTKRCVLFYNMTAGSNVRSFLTVSRNDESKKIAVVVRYVQYGDEAQPAWDRRMYSIPRIPDGYTLETKTEWLGIHDGLRSVTEILPSGTTEDLYDVVVVDTTTAYVVGANGTIRKSIDKGRTWIAQQSGVTTTLRGVWACSPQNVYAVGDRGVLLRTRNGGTTWERMTNPVGGGEFRDVRMFRDSVGVAVGRIQTEDGVRGLILHTSNGGTTWKNYQPPSGMTLPLLNCLAASQDRTLFMESGNNAMTLLAAGAKITGAISNIMISYDYGNLWKSYGTGTLNELNGIGWSNILSCYVGNSKSISEDEKYASQNSTGNLIQSKLFPNIVTENLRSAHGNPGTFYGLTIVGENGFLIETFKGVGWYTIPSGTSETLNGIHWISSGSANGFWRLAVGNRGTIVRIYKDNNLWTP